MVKIDFIINFHDKTATILGLKNKFERRLARLLCDKCDDCCNHFIRIKTWSSTLDDVHENLEPYQEFKKELQVSNENC